MQPCVVGIRFTKTGKIYHFDATKSRDLIPGDFAIVETRRGRQLGQVVQVFDPPPPKLEGKWKPIRRKATPRDLVLRQVWERKQLEVTINARSKIAELGLTGVKIVGSEFSLDGRHLTILYSREGEGKLDLRRLRKALRRMYSRSKIDLRMIGPRDLAKLIGGMGACGLETRCCSKFLTDFSPISIKMAKAQGISLSPSEITGMCGRLRCCLIYEYEQYVKARKELPKRGRKVVTPMGDGKVIDVLPLKEAVIVDIPDTGRHEFMKHEIQPWEELKNLQRKSHETCDRHGNGECNCAKMEE